MASVSLCHTPSLFVTNASPKWSPVHDLEATSTQVVLDLVGIGQSRDDTGGGSLGPVAGLKTVRLVRAPRPPTG